MVATPAIETAVAARGGTGLLEPMVPESMNQELEKIDDNLKKIYVDADVPPLIQAQLAKYSFRSIAKFQTFASSSDKVTEICKSLGLGDQALPNMGNLIDYPGVANLQSEDGGYHEARCGKEKPRHRLCLKTGRIYNDKEAV